MNLPIQYLRGIAAVLVVCAHFVIFPVIKNFNGAIGVDIFFIISGFIMSATVEKYKDRKREFLANRIIRIYPLYIIVSVPIFLLYAVSGTMTFGIFLKSLFFFGGAFTTYKDPALFSGWTLLYEFVFYLIIIAFSSNKKATNIILVSMGLIGAILPIHNAIGIVFNTFFLYFFIGFNFSSILKAFKPNKPKVHLCVSLLLLLLVMLYKDEGANNYVPRQFITMGNLLLPRIIVWGVPCVYFVVSFIRSLEGAKEIVVLKYLGDRSYSIYLVHTLLIILAKNPIVHQFFYYLPNKLYYMMFFLSILPLANLTYNIIEVGFGKWVKGAYKNNYAPVLKSTSPVIP